MASDKPISIKEALTGKYGPLIDVRSESEYSEACIPSAYNLPLLNDDERVRVGTTYKQQGPEEAKSLGLEIVSPKLPKLYNSIQNLSKDGKAVLYCWRGGMRSQSLVQILQVMGLNAVRMEGGYKAYRRYVNSVLEEEIPGRPMVVLHGLTGVGKTDVIKQLQNIGIGALDLEALACNRGSVFGTIGMEKQPSQKMFEGKLADQIVKYKNSPFLVVEGESRRIGRIILPEKLFSQMSCGTHILLYTSKEKRISRLIEMYSNHVDADDLLAALERLNNRLGKQRIMEISQFIKDGKMEQAAEILLDEYYDPLYRYPNGPHWSFELNVEVDSVINAADIIVAYLRGKFHVSEKGVASFV